MAAKTTNTPTYSLAGSATKVSGTMQFDDAALPSWVLWNSDTTYGVAVVTGKAAAPAVTVPGSATVPVICSMVGPGQTQTFDKNPGDLYFSAIWEGAATGKLYLSVGPGE